MAKKTPQKPRQRADALEEAELPPGVKLVRKFEGHHLRVWSAVFDPQGGMLATGSGGNADAIYNELAANLIPNAHLAAAGVVAVNRAQERGYTAATAV